ncbi:MAG: tetratricopeptide repeat protein [Bryobacterales bacterium]|nr:tetratricopeptide repeat protein [Bryobacteraceae bacterium]MDW8129445.1 tetratricopeptide repeat protein [Bryobacterales bacterium]
MRVLDAEATYSRAQARRLLGISESQLRSWERQQLIPARNQFHFADLLALGTLRKLAHMKLSAKRIRQILGAVRRKVGELEEPLRQLRIVREGRKIAVIVGGRKMEPLTGQLLLDFDEQEIQRLVNFPGARPAPRSPAARAREAEQWFAHGLELERAGAPFDQVLQAYLKAVTLDPRLAGAMVNLGTLFFHRRMWAEAELWYRRALEVEPGYALAHYNLGNLYDEMDDRERAIAHYEQAVRLDPDYADAHYNLALLYQSSERTLEAVRHWQIYLRLDPVSPWAVIARRELEKLRQATIVQGGQPGPQTESGSSE